MALYPESTADILERHTLIRAKYSPAIGVMDEVELLFKGEFPVPEYLRDIGISPIKPSEPHAILRKIDRVIGLRSKVTYESVRRADTDSEQALCDKLERFLKAYYRALRKTTGVNVFRRGMAMAFLRGRSGFHTVYEPGSDLPCIRVRVYDPKTYFPFYSQNGIEWFTREKWMSRLQLKYYFEGLSEKAKRGMTVPDLTRRATPNSAGKYEACEDMQEVVRLVEYWDAERFCWTVDEYPMVQSKKHNYGGMTLRELKLGEMPFDDDPRWETEPLLAPIADDLKAKTVLLSKMIAGMEQFFFPRGYVENEEGAVSMLSPYSPPGTLTPKRPDTKIEWQQPTPNTQIMRETWDLFTSNIGKNTFHESLYGTDVQSNVSGFAVQQAQAGNLDDIADFRDQGEQAFGLVSGDVLRMHENEEFAPKDGWEYPLDDYQGRRKTIQKLLPSEIDGHYDVNVSVNPQLPQDKIQQMTLVTQLTTRDPVTGEPPMDMETAMEYAGMQVEDRDRMRKALAWNKLEVNDPSIKQLVLSNIKAENAAKIEEMGRNVATTQRRFKKKEAARIGREIEQGMSDDAIIPAELATGDTLRQLADVVDGGQTLQMAVKSLQGNDMPQIGRQVQNAVEDTDVQQLLAQIFGNETSLPAEGQPGMGAFQQGQMAGAQAANGPNGLTGYQGINPAASPPAAQGAQPRQSVDQARVQAEQLNQQVTRGALPPPA